MKSFGYEVLYDDEHIRKLKVMSDIEEGTATINKDTGEIQFFDFIQSFERMLPKGFVEEFLRKSITNFPEKKVAGFGS